MESSSLMDTFEAQFGKKITLYQLYGLFKHSQQYIFNKKILQYSYLFEICEKALFLVNGLNKKLFPGCRLPVSQLVAKFSCSDAENCMIGEFSEWSSAKLNSDIFNTRSTSDSDSTSASDASDADGEDENADEDSISY